MNEQTATRVAFVTVPAIPAVIGAVLTPVTQEFDMVTVVGFAAIFYVITGAVTAAIAAPIFYWLRRRNLVRWWTALLTGFFIGVLVALSIRLSNIRYLPGDVLRHDILLLGFEGAASALVFWIIWKSGSRLGERSV
jgi:hypothetical protein